MRLAPRRPVILATPIQIKKTTEKSNARWGLVWTDRTGISLESTRRRTDSNKQPSPSSSIVLAPVQAVTASGTINRGRGVYFKLRWTAQQILEGEKTFHNTSRPEQWRGSLMDVSVIAQGERKSFGWERETKTIGSANFVVAVFKDHDTRGGDNRTILGRI